MIAIIANPVAHNFSYCKLKDVVEHLKQNGKSVDIFLTKKAGDGSKIAEKVDGIYEVVAAFGGDGIVNEIINAPLRRSALAVLPAGTTNVLAIELFGAPSLKKATDAIVKGRVIEARLGNINGRRFILMVGAGFDGESVYSVDFGLKRVLGKIAYVVAGIKAYLNLNSDCFELKIGNDRYFVRWAIVSKVRRYAGRFIISKKVSLGSPLFDVFFCDCKSRKVILPYCNVALFSGAHLLNMPFIHHRLTDENIYLGESYIQVDGDYYRFSDADISLDGSVRLIV